jgi:hypothetical protein
MFSKSVLSTLIITLFTFISCTDQKKESWSETMRVHDEVMLKMQENGEIESKLNELIQRGHADTNSVLFTKVDTLQMALDQLSKADEEMMDWMAAIRAPKKSDDVDSTLQYHAEQKAAIIEVGEHMDAARLHAEDLLHSLEK